MFTQRRSDSCWKSRRGSAGGGDARSGVGVDQAQRGRVSSIVAHRARIGRRCASRRHHCCHCEYAEAGAHHHRTFHVHFLQLCVPGFPERTSALATRGLCSFSLLLSIKKCKSYQWITTESYKNKNPVVTGFFDSHAIVLYSSFLVFRSDFGFLRLGEEILWGIYSYL